MAAGRLDHIPLEEQDIANLVALVVTMVPYDKVPEKFRPTVDKCREMAVVGQALGIIKDAEGS